MSQQLIQQYLNELADLRRVSGEVRESVVSEAFKSLLKAWGRSKDLTFIPQYEYQTARKTRVYPDGALLHGIRVPFGYWEAKDEKDDIDEEIETKFRKGYPQDNIVFEDSRQAVLIQNRQEVMRCPVDDPGKLQHLLTLFFDFERPEIADFRKAVERFKTDLPSVLDALRTMIAEAHSDNAAFRAAEEKFLKHAMETINPALGQADVREMLIQHILTEEIFAHVFDNSDFHRFNNVARELYALEGVFFKGELKWRTLKALEPYYAAIRSAAALVSSHNEKQKFLKVIYENFYKVYNPKAADRLGVVYTPNEIVRFMIEGADWLCRKHFGRGLIDENVEILDPASGTGTFVTEMLEYFRGQPDKLRHKYKHEIHANEVAILPYYVANLNIEATYAAITGQFAEFENLCFVDTLDNIGWSRRSDTKGAIGDLFGALSEENVQRIQRQNARKISIIIGNPPYNANQKNENENNKNRTYPAIDSRIKATYIRASTAQKTKLYDMYARFFRWASDRLPEGGIIAFVSNRSFIDSRTFDGFRKLTSKDFREVWIVDLKGNARTSGERRRKEGGNIFENKIKVGIAISFWVKTTRGAGCAIRYEAARDYASAEEKRDFVAARRLNEREFLILTPNAKHDWIDIGSDSFTAYIPIASRSAKRANNASQQKAIFGDYSMGFITARDEWLIGETGSQIKDRVKYFMCAYNRNLEENRKRVRDGLLPSLAHDLKWSRSLKAGAERGELLRFDGASLRKVLYRPFVSKIAYFGSGLVEMPNKMPAFFQEGRPNVAIFFNDPGARAPFGPLASASAAEYHLAASSDGFQALPRYRFASDGTRLDNLTDWGLEQFRKHYEVGGADGEVSPFSHARHGRGGRAAPDGGRAEGADGTPASLVEDSAALRASARIPPSGTFSHADARERDHGRPITKDAIFHYVYGVLHDPVYRETYALNLKREFPRIPFYPDFWRWAGWGERLMALHIGYETVEPWPLKRIDVADDKAAKAGLKPKPILKADQDNGIIRIDSETTLTGVPAEAWQYRLGNRSALDWILDQYKEKTPRDLTIRERFNTYRLADHKEKVIDLLLRVTRVSVETAAIVEAMGRAHRGSDGGRAGRERG